MNMMPAHRTWTLVLSLAALGALALSGCAAEPLEDEIGSAELAAANGNGAPSGAHYNLNLIGVPQDKTAEMKGNTGGRIFAPLWGNAKIRLTEGEDFNVLDANGTDTDGATFEMPNPDPDGDGVTEYSVWARALGTPGGYSTTTTCMEDAEGTYCSTEQVVLVRNRGQSTFDEVSRELLTVYCDLDGDGDLEASTLFEDDNYHYYWDYDNKGLKLAQLRFYPIPANVSYP